MNALSKRIEEEPQTIAADCVEGVQFIVTPDRKHVAVVQVSLEKADRFLEVYKSMGWTLSEEEAG